MNEKIRNHVAKHNEKNNWGTEDEDIIKVITEADPIYEEVICERRHWNDTFRVCKIDGMLIGFNSAKTTSDMGIYDVGWEFAPDTICEVVEEVVTKTIYKAKKEEKE